MYSFKTYIYKIPAAKKRMIIIVKDWPWKILILQYDVDTACLYLSTNGSDENIDAETLDSQSKYNNFFLISFKWV